MNIGFQGFIADGGGERPDFVMYSHIELTKLIIIIFRLIISRGHIHRDHRFMSSLKSPCTPELPISWVPELKSPKGLNSYEIFNVEFYPAKYLGYTGHLNNWYASTGNLIILKSFISNINR